MLNVYSHTNVAKKCFNMPIVTSLTSFQLVFEKFCFLSIFRLSSFDDKSQLAELPVRRTSDLSPVETWECVTSRILKIKEAKQKHELVLAKAKEQVEKCKIEMEKAGTNEEESKMNIRL